MGTRAFLLAAGGLLLTALHAPAASGWMESRAAVDEVVADTTTTAPASALTPLLAGTPFDNFRYPHVDARGAVTFIADDESCGSKGLNHGIYRSVPGQPLACLVRGGEARVPGGTETLHTFRGLQMDADGAKFVFSAFDGTDGRGLYHWADGRLTLVAHTGVTTLPGDKEPLKEIKYGALHGTRVLYQATTARRGDALVLHDLATGGDRVLFRPGDRAASNFLGEQNWLTADGVLFRAGQVANQYYCTVTGRPGVYGWLGVKDWSGASGELSPARLRAVVDSNTRVTRDDGREAVLENIASAPTDGQVTAFAGYGKDFHGLYCAELSGGPVRTIMDGETEVSGLFRGHANFGIWPTVVDRSVIFTVHAAASEAKSDEYNGVFLYRVDRDELFLLADSRTPVDGKAVRGYEIAGHVLANNRFALTVKFRDGSSGVYLATIPAKSYRRMGSPAATADR